jgi:hypothetical protein
MAGAEALFRAAFQNLARYRHELYPVFLKAMASFWSEEDSSPQKRARILEFVGLKEE